MADSPYEQVATAIQAKLETEFAPESISVVHDKLHPSLGLKKALIGISPEGEPVNESNMVSRQINITVQFYNWWEKDVDPNQSVNPFTITAYAERFKRSMQEASAEFPGTSDVWFFNVMEINYPDDPTGNKTRFEAKVVATGNNTGLIETTA